MSQLDRLHDQVKHAYDLLHLTYNAIHGLEIKVDERTSTTVPLILGSLSMTDALLVLLLSRTEQAWVAALPLHRCQMEYVFRAAFFAKAASRKELMAFRNRGKMPKRGKKPMYLAHVIAEADRELGWEIATLIPKLTRSYRDLSGFVHGGKEVLAMYTQRKEWGDIELPWDQLHGFVNAVVVFSQLAVAVAMLHAPLQEDRLEAVVRPCYDAMRSYYATWAGAGEKIEAASVAAAF